ncbi:phosphate signaling complex protein PhoU [Denitromonas halophila]|uniref:Phosphate-specific transport system accessory protein PhoU n=1 Tax=Denitromonas halophila TaxID=1629404 RepID=A0A557QE65_9RHOO|nr:phosphate signaling complex protein PhoU [Denitromonas halophila]TVO51197.1 phosphate signaling complex protein PhoU [Denitromonas halophila]
MTEHTSKQFEFELESIRTRVLQMGGMVELQIAKAIEALATGDLDALEEVVDQDHRINLLELELDDACVQIVAKRQPAANDLRLVMSVVKVITDLERIGDEAKKIAKMSKRLHSSDSAFVPRIELRHAANLAIDMLRKALDAFARLDMSAAAEVVRQDREVDAEFKGIIRQLITFVMEDPRTISRGIDILFMAKAIERIGDHAKNVAEYVIYMVKGQDVRHTGLANIERAANTD